MTNLILKISPRKRQVCIMTEVEIESIISFDGGLQTYVDLNGVG